MREAHHRVRKIDLTTTQEAEEMAKFTRMSPAQTAARDASNSGNSGGGNRRRNRRRRSNT